MRSTSSHDSLSSFRNLKFGDLAVLCGAGVSRDSGIPLASELMRGILSRLALNDSEAELVMNWKGPFEAYMQTLSGSKCFTYILDVFESKFPTDTDTFMAGLLKAAFARTSPTTCQADADSLILGLLNAASALDTEPIIPTDTHMFIAGLLRSGYARTLVTTNFDTLIETALDGPDFKRERDFWVASEGKELSIRKTELPTVLKIHGSIENRDALGITIRNVSNHTHQDNIKEVIDFIFSAGKHRMVLIMGYSCSDIFDIIPCIQNVPRDSRKEVHLVVHNDDAGEITVEDLHGVRPDNTWSGYSGKKYICQTRDFVRDVWALLPRLPDGPKGTKCGGDTEAHLNLWKSSLHPCESLWFSGDLLRLAGASSKAGKYYDLAIELAKGNNDRLRAAEALLRSVHFYFAQGNDKERLKKFRESISVLIDLLCESASIDPDRRNVMLNEAKRGDKMIEEMESLASNASENARMRRTIECYNEILPAAQAYGEGDESAVYLGIGDAHRRLGEYAEALTNFGLAVQIAKQHGLLNVLMEALKGSGDAYAGKGESSKARSCYEESLKLARATKNLQLEKEIKESLHMIDGPENG